MNLRRLTTILPSLVLLGCAATGERPAASGLHPWDGDVRAHGALRAMLHEGQTDATVTLDSMLPDPDLYAVGALAGLSGEITVVRGEAYLSFPEEADATRTETSLQTDAAATLLVVSKVPAWHGVVTSHEIRFEELDDEIARLATAAGMSLDERFPFLIEGSFDDLEWHVIDGRRLTAGGSSHQDHLAAAVKARLDRTPAVLVGFYSESDQGVFTHMGSKTHIHCTVDEPVSSGHVDHVTIPAGTTVEFPAMGNERSDEEMQQTAAADN